MTARASRIINKDDSLYGFMVECPGCGFAHVFTSGWKFDGSLEHPTFTPSMLVHYPWGDPPQNMICHSFVTAGKIRFLDDCTHALKGQTVDLPVLGGK